MKYSPEYLRKAYYSIPEVIHENYKSRSNRNNEDGNGRGKGYPEAGAHIEIRWHTSLLF
jgi:hypothetical protein